jgi:peptidoglycan-associated lipoprotein
MKATQLLPLMMALLLLGACSKTVMENQTAVEQQPEPVVQAEPEPAPPPVVESQPAPVDTAARDQFVNDNIYFDYDSASLKPEAQSLLQIKAQWLKDNPDVLAVLIEGHCDERGTEAYNLALGAKRADAVKKFLVDLGLGDRNLEIQSYSEEKPLASGHNETAWAKNRRACFVIN